MYEICVAIAGAPSMKRSDGAVHGGDAMQGTVEDSPLLAYMVLAKAKTEGGVPVHVRFPNDRGAHNPLARQGSHTSHRPTHLQSTKRSDSPLCHAKSTPRLLPCLPQFLDPFLPLCVEHFSLIFQVLNL